MRGPFRVFGPASLRDIPHDTAVERRPGQALDRLARPQNPVPRRSPVQTRLALGIAAGAAAASLVLAAGANAQTTTKSSSTNSCPSQQSVMTSNWYGSTAGYLCAQEYHDGNWNIGAGDSETFTQDTNVAYFPQYYCWDSSDDKDVTYAHAEIFGSGTVTATNWGSGSHVWGAGYLYTLGSGTVTGWTNGCYDNASVWQQTPSILTLSSISASGLPDNGASEAGAQYSIKATVAPASAAVGQMAALQDNGVSVAAAAIQSDGTAKFTWTPALMGQRKIQVVWPGTSSTLGNLTDAYTVNVSGGTGMSITPGTFTFDGGQATAHVTVNIDTSPNPMPAKVPVVLVDASTANPTATPPVLPTQLSPPVTTPPTTPVMATPTSTGATTGSAEITFPAILGHTYKLVAQAPNTASTTADPLPPVGQSYPTALAAPVASTTATTFPSKVYVGTQPTWSTCSLVPVSTTVSPSSATGTVTPNDTGSTGATLFGGAAKPQWCPPSTPGTYTPVVSYSGDSADAPSSSPGTSSVQVVSGGPVGSGITLSGWSGANYSTGRANGTLTVSGGWSGTASIYDSAHSWKLVGTGTITNGSGVISIAFLENQTMKLVPKFTIDGSQYFQGNMEQWFVTSNLSGGYERTARETARETARPARPGQRSGTRGTSTAPASLVAQGTGARSVRASRRVTASSRSVTLKCPKGYFPLHSAGFSSGPSTQFGVSVSGRAVKITSPSANVGSRMSAQATCRAEGATALVIRNKAYGTRAGDHFVLPMRSAVVLAGPGRDRIALGGRGAVGWGGFGGDRIAVRGADSVAGGGPGPDRLVALGNQRVLLIGGTGPDTLIGNAGPALLNARDGNGGDRVICRSSANRAMVDPGDRVSGSCTMTQ